MYLKYDKYICSLTVSKDNKIKVINDFKKIYPKANITFKNNYI